MWEQIVPTVFTLQMARESVVHAKLVPKCLFPLLTARTSDNICMLTKIHVLHVTKMALLFDAVFVKSCMEA